MSNIEQTLGIKNNYYEINLDNEKNQIYFKVKGFWPSLDAVPNFEEDWMKIGRSAKKGFTIIADLLDMEPFPNDVDDLNTQVQGKLMGMGVRKVAQVASVEVAGAVNQMAKKGGIRHILRAFYDVPTAKKWLDIVE